MAILIDTNPLLRAAEPDHPMHIPAVSSIETLLLCAEELHIAPQNLIEYWGAATRPIAAQNGLGMSPEQAALDIERLKQQFTVLPDTDAIYPEWERLVTRYGVIGRQVHDARLVAVMLVYGVTAILTFNGKDFRRYTAEGIFVIDPVTVT